jgi:methylglutaconyl-CoA hydratase
VPLVETGFANGVMTITLCDEQRRNTLSRQLVRELVAAIDEANDDANVRVVVVTNRGGVFCAGADLTEQSSPNTGEGRAINLGELFQRIQRSPKPFVGRLAGHCVAGGVGLAAVMDISIAVDNATFGFTEVRIGVVPAMIAVVCLPKMRPADAQASFLRGNRFGALEAARMGLINQVVAPDELDAAVRTVVNDLLAGEPHALAVAKQLTLRVPTLSTDEAYAWTTELSAQLFTSDAAREGMTAFLEKRPASWVTRSTAD